MILHDANILVYDSKTDAPQHRASRAIVDASIQRLVPGVLVPQVLLEFYSVVTNGRRVPLPLSPTDAWSTIETLRAEMPVFDLQPAAIPQLSALVAARRPIGRTIFDLFLVAQMRTHGIGQICTYTTADFSGIPGIEPLTPEQTLVRYGIPFTP